MNVIQELWERVRTAFQGIEREADVPAELVTRPYPNEHACRLEDPDKYDTCRRGSRTADGKDFSVIYCKKGDGPMEQQAFRYPIETWTAEEARAHCKASQGSFEAAKEEKEAERAERDQPPVWHFRSGGFTYVSFDGGANWSSYKGEVSLMGSDGKERGLGINELAEQVGHQLELIVDGEFWLTDMYVEDDGAISAILSGSGKLYKAAVVVADGVVTVAEPVEVQIEYTPRAKRRALQIARQEGRTVV